MITRLTDKCKLCLFKEKCTVFKEILLILANTHIAKSNFSPHLIGTYKQAITISNNLFKQNMLSKEQKCLAIYASLIHDLGYNQDLFICAAYLKQEKRHSYFLELFLRVIGCFEFAKAIRHSAPQIIIDMRLGNLSLQQLICTYSDATTDTKGVKINLKERDDSVRKRKSQNANWNEEAQCNFINLLLLFERWLSNPLSEFGVFAKPKNKIDVTFLERFDDKYAIPDSPLKTTSSVYHITNTIISNNWNIHTYPDTSYITRKLSLDGIINKLNNPGFVISSWIKVIELLAKKDKSYRVLLFRGFHKDTMGSRLKRIKLLYDTKKVDLIIVVSAALKNRLKSHGIESIVISNGVDNNFQSSYTPVKKNYVLFVGATIKEKGIDLVNKVALRIKQMGIKTLVIGDAKIYGNKRENHSKYLNNVEYLNFIDNNDLPTFYSDALVTIIPTNPRYLIEGFSKVSLESLSMGTPLIVSKSGNLPSWIIKNKTGWVMKKYDYKEIVNLISNNLSQLQNNYYYNECINLSKNYHWEYTAWQLERVFETIIMNENKGKNEDILLRFNNFIKDNHPKILKIKSNIEIISKDSCNNKIDGNKKILVFEPHPDDVAISCALHLLDMKNKGYEVTVVTVFPKTDICYFRYAGLFPINQSDYTKLRMNENMKALTELLGFKIIFLSHCSATLRGEANIINNKHVHPYEKLKPELASIINNNSYDYIYIPLAIKSHVDHILIRDSVMSLKSNRKVLLYEDAIYNEEGVNVKYHIKKWNANIVEFASIKETKKNLKIKAVLLSKYLSQIPVDDAKSLYAYAHSLKNKISNNCYERIWQMKNNYSNLH